MNKILFLIIAVIIFSGGIIAIRYLKDPLDLTEVLTISFAGRISNGKIKFQIVNKTNYDIDIVYDHLYFPGVFCVSFEDGSTCRFADGSYVNIRSTSVSDAKQLRILRNSILEQNYDISNLAIIDSSKMTSGKNLAWIEIDNLFTVINSTPKIKFKISIESEKIDAETMLLEQLNILRK